MLRGSGETDVHEDDAGPRGVLEGTSTTHFNKTVMFSHVFLAVLKHRYLCQFKAYFNVLGPVQFLTLFAVAAALSRCDGRNKDHTF